MQNWKSCNIFTIISDWKSIKYNATMGNVEMHDLGPPPKDDSEDLDLSTHINYRTYCKHINGEYSKYCMKELPDEVSETMRLHERVDLSFNCLKFLPDNLPYGLPHLTVLNVSYNELLTLPDTICFFFHLRELILAHNKITILPLNLYRLTKLKKLDISHNLLVDLPEAMGCMKTLQKLNVSHNKLQNLPESLGSSPTLEVLLAISNECKTTPPQNICEEGSQATLKFLRKLAQNGRPSEIRNLGNTFPRVRGNIVQTSVPNPHSARAQYVQIQTDTMNTASRIKTPLLLPLNATSMHIDKLRDSIIGLIYGAVVGDALGIATEFLSCDECKFYYDENDFVYRNIIKDEHRAHWTKGDWTSNIDQMLLVLDSLLHWAGVIDELEFAKRLFSYKKNGIPELGIRENYMYSNTINLVLQVENYAENPHQVAQSICHKSGSERTNGTSEIKPAENVILVDSGALPRALILGIPHFHDLQEVISNSVRICRSTHSDERCVATCVSLSVLVALILQGSYCLDDTLSLNLLFEAATAQGAVFVKDNDAEEEFRKCSKFADFSSIGLTETGKLCHTFKPYAAALCALKQQGDFRNSLISLLMHGGYSSMNGCITGAVLGCKFGFSKIPAEWIDGLLPRNREFLNTKINALLDMMAVP